MSAYDAGKAARMSGRERSANPYPHSDGTAYRAREWERGWSEAAPRQQ